jgi:hypothetical protein
MRRLPLRIVCFALIFGTLDVGIDASYRRALARRIASRERLLDLLSRRPVIFFGDSHIACGIDNGVDRRIANLGDPNEFYVLTAPKVRRLHPKVAVIGAWVHDFLPYFQERFPKVVLSRYDLWSRSLLPDERADLMGGLGFEDRAYLAGRALIPFLGTQLATDVSGPSDGLGGFMANSSRSTAMSTAAAHRLDQMRKAASREPVALQVRALDRLLGTCDAAGTTVIILSTPVHPSLRTRIPSWMSSLYEGVLAELIQRHRVRYWDESARPMPPGSFHDPDHLSSKGATEFTRVVVQRLVREGLLPPRSAVRRVKRAP